ncbi:MAG TPA: serpin family protein, partial [Kofleriaceae bacterium]|nr:serpin family protein [Kofleriaceae bacterium]
ALAMYVVLPSAADGLATVEHTLDAATFARAVAALAPEPVALALPKFTASPPVMQLGKMLAALGMPLAFDRARADFSGMAAPRTSEEELVLDEVFHQTYVKTDEVGTVAAAATAAIMAVRSAMARPRAITVDRPFLFAIANTRTSEVIFLGRIVDPR